MRSFRAQSFDRIESKALINFSFCVQCYVVGKHNVTWRDDSTRMVYIRLEVVDEQYAITDDKEGSNVLKVDYCF